MSSAPALLDTDILSEISRGHAKVTARATEYLRAHGAFTLSAITVFERLRGYEELKASGRPRPEHDAQFRALLTTCRILPLDAHVAEVAAGLWARCSRKQRANLGDLLIAATAIAYCLPLVTRNRRDFAAFAKLAGVTLPLVDWSR